MNRADLLARFPTAELRARASRFSDDELEAIVASIDAELGTSPDEFDETETHIGKPIAFADVPTERTCLGSARPEVIPEVADDEERHYAVMWPPDEDNPFQRNMR